MGSAPLGRPLAGRVAYSPGSRSLIEGYDDPRAIPNLNLWLPSHHQSHDHGDSIATLNDRSGRGNNATQATGTNQPVFVASPNLLQWSEAFDNASWSKTRTTVSANAVANPVNGSITADTVIEDTSTNSHIISQSGDSTAGTTYTLSAYAKQAGREGIQLRLGPGAFTDATERAVNFDLVNGTASVAAGTIEDFSIADVGDGWYRCVMTAAADKTATGILAWPWIVLIDGGGNISYVGDGTSGVYLYGAQLVEGSIPRTYSATNATAGSNDYPLLDFDGVDDRLDLTSLPTASDLSFTAFLVAYIAPQVDQTSTHPGLFRFVETVGANYVAARVVSTTRWVQVLSESGGVINAEAALNFDMTDGSVRYGQWNIWEFAYAPGANLDFMLNGARDYTTSTHTVGSGVSGNSLAIFDEEAKSQWREVICYNRKLTTAERLAVRQYLAKRHADTGVTLA